MSTPKIGLTYHKTGTTTAKLIGYVDADHAGDYDNRRSHTGYIYRLEPIANKSGFANRTKHIALRYFFVKDEIEKGRLELSYCPTSEMAADYLTKKLEKQKFDYCMLLTGQSHVISNEGNDTPEAKGGVGNI
ncbi:unnamed protein product [Closterium sp. NIES-53]